jgi:Na+-translocating ferredoxin:NAD+ oxidoreductase RNF subunit RnfB
MVIENEGQNKLRDIVNALPKKNCGKCGYETCAKFGTAVMNGAASPFGCRHNSSAGYEISKILGLPVPEGQTAPHVGTGHGEAGGRHHGHHSGRSGQSDRH